MLGRQNTNPQNNSNKTSVENGGPGSGGLKEQNEITFHSPKCNLPRNLDQFPHIFDGAIVHIPSLGIVVDDGEDEHNTIDEASPVHLLDCWIGVAWEKGEDERENKKHQTEPI